MPAVGVRPVLAHFKQALRACENASERGVVLSREEAARAAAGAAKAVPTIFSLMRENEISPDDDCYSLAIRSGRRLGGRLFIYLLGVCGVFLAGGGGGGGVELIFLCLVEALFCFRLLRRQTETGVNLFVVVVVVVASVDVDVESAVYHWSFSFFSCAVGGNGTRVHADFFFFLRLTRPASSQLILSPREIAFIRM